MNCCDFLRERICQVTVVHVEGIMSSFVEPLALPQAVWLVDVVEGGKDRTCLCNIWVSALRITLLQTGVLQDWPGTCHLLCGSSWSVEVDEGDLS